MKFKNQHIEVAKYLLSSDAHILRGLLESEGIKVFVFNEGFSSLDPADAVASGGVKIHVPFDQKEKALPIVEEFFENLKEEATLKCPNCDSTHLKHDYKEHFKHAVINLFSALGGVNASNGVRYYKRCSHCGYGF